MDSRNRMSYLPTRRSIHDGPCFRLELEVGCDFDDFTGAGGGAKQGSREEDGECSR